MTLRLRCLIGLCLALLAAGAPEARAAALWDKIKDSGTLICGALPAYPIVSYAVDGPDQYQGYAPAFCRAVAAALSTDMNEPIHMAWQTTTWATVVLDLQAGRIDMFPGLSESAERRQALDLAGPMYDLADCMLNRKGFAGFPTWHGYDDPQVRIAVTSGTTQEKAVRTLTPNAQILAFKEVSQAVLAVQSGHADAMNLAVTTCLHTMKTAAGIFGGYVVPEPVNSTGSYAGMRRDGDGRFATWLQKWAETNRANGQVRAIFIEQMRIAGFDLDNLPSGLKF